jgi:hypothetical protein
MIIYTDWINQGPKKLVSAAEKSIKTPKTPFVHKTRDHYRPLLLHAQTSTWTMKIQISQQNQAGCGQKYCGDSG